MLPFAKIYKINDRTILKRETFAMAVEMNLHALPEGCIANALAFTSPRDACRLSLVDSTFRYAAQSDDVWERFLPRDYRDILGRSNEGVELLRSFGSKKELYFYLCDNPILIDGATKSFSLDKSSGKKCYMLSAKDLYIVWGDTPRYWRWISIPESRFPTVAELLEVCWLEIRGKIKTSMLSPNTTYSAYLVFASKSRVYGFEFTPAEASVAVSGQESEIRTFYLDPEGPLRHTYRIMPRSALGTYNGQVVPPMFLGGGRGLNREVYHQASHKPEQREDGWMEVELGEYYVEEGQDEELVMSLLEVKAGNWKSGLIVEGIELRPKPTKDF